MSTTMSMTRKKALPAKINDRYKQTDISTYFKVRNWTTMNKENNHSEESVLSPRKKARPIYSDDETEQSINTLKTTPNSIEKTRKKREVRSTSTFPIPLPSYMYSESSDSDDNSNPEYTKRVSDIRQCKKRKSRLSLNKNIPIKSQNNINAEMHILVSSGDDDFETSPAKIRKRQPFVLNRRKLSQQETFEKVNNFVSSIDYSNSYNKLVKSPPSKEETTNTTSSGISSLPSTSKVPKTRVGDTIGVHKPITIIATTPTKQPPRILLEKRKSNSDISFKSVEEFISTDFTSNKTLEILSTSRDSNDSDKTVVYEHDINFIFTDNVNSTPKKIICLENIVIKSPRQTLQQCTLSPIKANVTINNTIIPSSSSIPSTNLEDTMRSNANSMTEEEVANSTWITKLFVKIVKYIGLHSHLKTMLTVTESDILKRFFVISPEYQFFCFKLFVRIQKWYNIFKLKETLRMKLTESEVRQMYDCLNENKFVEIDFSKEPCVDLLNNLDKPKLVEICNAFKLKVTNEKKCGIVQKLLLNCNRQTTLTTMKTTETILRQRIKDHMGICVKLSPDLFKLFNKVHLLYSFTTSDFNSTDKLHLFMSKVINKDIYMPAFKINEDVKIFSSLEQFSRFSQAYECKQAMVQAYEKKEVGHMFELSELAYSELQVILECIEEPKASYLMRFTAGYKYTRTLSLGAKYLTRHYPERVEEWLTFLIQQNQYCCELRGIWYDLLIMVQYNYLKLHEHAANTLIEALDRKDLSNIHMQDLNNRAEMIKGCKSHKISELLRNKISFVQPSTLREIPSIEIDAQAIRGQPGAKGKRVYTKKTDQGQCFMSVEEIALQHYYKNGYIKGLHCEGSLLATIFFVLFWDIIYESPVKDAFIVEIQYVPLDLMSPEFYTNRKVAIDQRLDEIRSKWPFGQLEQFISNIWEKHAHEKSYISDNLVNQAEDLYNIVLCIGRVKLTEMLERIAKNFKAYHSGLPDLFVWNVQKKQCKFVEVKGEKDKLSSKQKLWLDFLLSVGADAEVCHVHTVGSNTGRKVKKEEKKKVKKEEKKKEKKEEKQEEKEKKRMKQRKR